MEVSATTTGDKRAISGDLEARLRRYGFESGEPVHEFYLCFTVADALASMTESSYSNPIPVRLTSDEHDVNIPVIVTRADVRYQPFVDRLDETPPGCHERPDWYFEGWVLKSGFDPFDHITRVRVFRQGGDTSAATVFWQVIPKDPDPDAPLLLAP